MKASSVVGNTLPWRVRATGLATIGREASKHLISMETYLRKVTEVSSIKVQLANELTASVSDIGQTVIQAGKQVIMLRKFYYISLLKLNEISCSKLHEKEIKTIIEN